jgi:hypothetical protein
VKPREQLEDAKAMCTIVEAGVEMAKRLGPKGSAAYAPTAFVRRLALQFAAGADPAANARADPGAFDWNVFGSAVSNRFLAAPACGFMNGPMDAEVKTRRAVIRRRDEPPPGAAVNPDGVDDTKDDRQTDHAVKQMTRKLKEAKAKQRAARARQSGETENEDEEPMTAERLARNPKSFAQFVENVFTLSFLVKEGTARLVPQPREAIAGRRDASHVVEPANRDEGGQVERSTFVMHLDVEGWKALTRANGGAEGVLEPREETEEEVVVEMEGARRGSLAPRTADGAPATTGHPEAAAEEEEEEEEENAAAAGTRRRRNAAAGKKRKPKDVTNSQERDESARREKAAQRRRTDRDAAILGDEN